jgi:hypothetical protein
MKTISNGVSLQNFLDKIIEESVSTALHKRAAKEKARQSATSSSKPSLYEDDVTNDKDKKDSLDSSSDDKPKVSKTAADEKEKMKIGSVKTDDIIEKLNYIRAGRSFHDDTIHANMDVYIKSLSKEERIALYAFLKGISQIVSGEVEPDKAIDPDSKPANIEMKKSNEKESKTLKPNIIKKAGSDEKETDKAKEEDDSSPTPIKPKAKQ